MPNLFQSLARDDAVKVVEQLQKSDADINHKLYAGDQWLEGAGWIGPGPGINDPEREAVYAKIQKAFVSQNVVKEICNRHKGALVGREPAYGLTPQETPAAKGFQDKFRRGLRSIAAAAEKVVTGSGPGDKLIAEAEAAIDAWWDKRNVHSVIAAAVVSMLLGTRGPVRLFIAPDKMTPNAAGVLEIPKCNTLAEALDLIYLEHPAFGVCCLATDPASMEQGSIYVVNEPEEGQPLWMDAAGMEAVQISTSGQTMPSAAPPDAATDTGTRTNDQFHPEIGGRAAPSGLIGSSGGEKTVEVTYCDGESTIFRILRGEVEVRAALNLGGRIPLYEMRGDALITPQIRQNQYQLNRTLTMMGHNVDLAGFVERTFLNAEDPAAPAGDAEDETEQIRGAQKPRLSYGSARSTFLKGLEYTDNEGNVKYMPVNVVYREPVDPKSLIETIKRTYQNMLQEAQQMHVLISGDIAVSGEARRQAMADFTMSLLNSRPVVEGLVRWLLETVLAMGAAFMQEPGRYESLRATCDVRVEAGPIMAEDMRMIMAAVEMGIMARQTAQTRFNIDDVEAENRLIEDDMQYRLMYELQRSDALQELQAKYDVPAPAAAPTSQEGASQKPSGVNAPPKANEAASRAAAA